MRMQHVVGFALLLGVVLVLGIGALAGVSCKVEQMVFCRDIHVWEHRYQPLDRTTTFSPNDQYVYCFLKIHAEEATDVTVKWTTPSGELYHTHSYELEAPPRGYYTTWSLKPRLAINETRAATLLGTWRVRVSLSHGFGKTGEFKIIGPLPIPEPSPAPEPPPVPPVSPSPDTAAIVRFGGYRLQVTDLVKCRYFQNRPYASVIIRLPEQDKWLTLPDVVVDTGADVSSFPTSVAQALGLDLPSCEKVEFEGVGGTTVGYVGEAELGIIHLGGAEEEIDGYILGVDGDPFFFEASVAFLPGDEHKGIYLLGRVDVLRHLTLTFEEELVILRVRQTD